MGSTWFYPLFLPNTNKIRPHPLEEGRGGGVCCSVLAHIPQKRGGAGSGQRLWLEVVVVVVDEPKINRDRG